MNDFNIKNITILDTSIATLNVGDEIIMSAVNHQLYELFQKDRFLRIPTHEKLSKTSISLVRNSNVSFIGGSNLLSSYMNRYKQWNINILNSLLIKNRIILLGVGWRDYQKPPNLYTKILLKLLLDKNNLHSVRDSYTKNYLNLLGFKNVIITSCPTMWKLSDKHCIEIPSIKSRNVVFTLTDYDQNIKQDLALIKILKEQYENVYFWIQGKRDDQYFRSFDTYLINDIKIIPPNLKSYDYFLKTIDCDYIGTRLHGGIRALQNKKRTIIIGIDNRALEKKKDFNIVVLNRDNILKLPELINSRFKTEITIPIDNINLWKSHYKNLNENT